MSAYRIITLTVCLTVALIFQATRTEATCNVCSKYGIACVNETHFNLCEGNIPQTNTLYDCGGNKQCSNTKAKCVEPKAGVPPACQPKENPCGVCDGTKLFSCTSRTTFVQCDGTTPTDVTGTCSRGLVCDAQGGELCKNACTRPVVLQCDRDDIAL